MICTWCGVAGESDEDPQRLTEVKLDLTPAAIALISSAHAEDIVCKRCYGAFLRGFSLGEKYGRGK